MKNIKDLISKLPTNTIEVIDDYIASNSLPKTMITILNLIKEISNNSNIANSNTKALRDALAAAMKITSSSEKNHQNILENKGRKKTLKDMSDDEQIYYYKKRRDEALKRSRSASYALNKIIKKKKK